jgi:hypothetical protein
MQKQDGQIAHRRILPRSRHGKECARILEFAMHRLRRAIRKPRSASPMLVHFTTEIFVGLIATV